MIKKLSILALVIIAIVLIFNTIVMPLYVKHASLVQVPTVTGLTFLDAKKVLENAGLDVKQGDIRYDEAKPIGMVLDQNPPSGETVKKGRRVYLTLCGGEQLVEVPRLVGKTERDARFTLEQRNLQVGEIVKKFTTEQPEDFVISQIIQPGSKVKKSTKIDLIISNGALLGDLIIPDVIGKKLNDAKKIIEDRKLKVGKITYQPSDQEQGTVIDQYPKKDKSAKENTPVELFVAKKKTEKEKAFDVEGDIEQGNNREHNKDNGDKVKTETDKSKNKPDAQNPKDKSEKPKEKVPEKTENKEKTKDKTDKTKEKQEKK
ncbi:MAG: PASTA domain-containing protein [Bacteroidetes bacterium]|nr:PASTA domain-containing protein [Bacteroidota bacterium]